MSDRATLIDDLRAIAAELVEFGDALGPKHPMTGRRISQLGQMVAEKAATIHYGEEMVTATLEASAPELAIRPWKVTMQSVVKYVEHESATVIGTIKMHATDADGAVEHAVRRLKAMFPGTDRDTWEVLRVEIDEDAIAKET